MCPVGPRPRRSDLLTFLDFDVDRNMDMGKNCEDFQKWLFVLHKMCRSLCLCIYVQCLLSLSLSLCDS